jgi:hypothetical protein
LQKVQNFRGLNEITKNNKEKKKKARRLKQVVDSMGEKNAARRRLRVSPMAILAIQNHLF